MINISGQVLRECFVTNRQDSHMISLLSANARKQSKRLFMVSIYACDCTHSMLDPYYSIRIAGAIWYQGEANIITAKRI